MSWFAGPKDFRIFEKSEMTVQRSAPLASPILRETLAAALVQLANNAGHIAGTLYSSRPHTPSAESHSADTPGLT